MTGRAQENLEPPLVTPAHLWHTEQRPIGGRQHQESYRRVLSTQPSQVDFVIVFQPNLDSRAAEVQIQDLIARVQGLGLEVQVREGAEQGDVFVFVKCPDRRLKREVKAARSKDWLSGIRISTFAVEKSIEEEPITDAERLRLIYLMLTGPQHEHGAGITPKLGDWTCVETIFPLHNREFDSAWLRRWATKWFIDDQELLRLCEHFGTKVAMYFAFLQFYLLGLTIPTSLGLIAFFLLPEYSIIYSLALSLWSVVFLELWNRRQQALALKWDVRDCSRVEMKRAAYEDKSKLGENTNRVTSTTRDVFDKLARESLVIPFTLVSGGFLAMVLTVIFSVEVFLGEVYDGPLKSILTFTPTVLFSVLVGPFSTAYMKAAQALTLYENHETDSDFNGAITRKSFVLNFLTSYTALFLTLYVYLPFGHLLVPKLDVFGITSTYAAYGVTAKPFVLDNTRIRNQLFYFAVTAQLVNLFMENILPIIMRLVKGEARELQAKFTGQNKYSPKDIPEEKDFLKRVRFESTLPEYDIYGDYVELVVQFGYSVMFSPIWPLTPACAMLNNIVELRADAAKLCQNMRRPIPMRADSIGYWADHLAFLSWLGSLTTASILYLLKGDAASTKPFLHMLAVCLFSEHAYLVLRRCVAIVVSRLPNAVEAQVKQEDISIRKQYLVRLGHINLADEAPETSTTVTGTFNEAIQEATRIIRARPTASKQQDTESKKEL